MKQLTSFLTTSLLSERRSMSLDTPEMSGISVSSKINHKNQTQNAPYMLKLQDIRLMVHG